MGTVSPLADASGPTKGSVCSINSEIADQCKQSMTGNICVAPCSGLLLPEGFPPPAAVPCRRLDLLQGTDVRRRPRVRAEFPLFHPPRLRKAQVSSCVLWVTSIPSSCSLATSPQRSTCPTSCSEASDTSPPTTEGSPPLGLG